MEAHARELHRSIDARVSSILDNDAFMAVVLSLDTLRDPTFESRQSPEQIEALDLIEELLVRIGARPERLRLTVKRPLTAACLLANALRNEHCGKPLAWNMRSGVFVCDELHAPMCASTSLRELVDASSSPRADLTDQGQGPGVGIAASFSQVCAHAVAS